MIEYKRMGNEKRSMNEEPQTSFWEKLRHVLRPHLLVAVLVAFLVGMGVSPLLTDTQGKVEAT